MLLPSLTCFIQTKMHFGWVLGNCLVWVLLGLDTNCARYCTKSAEGETPGNSDLTPSLKCL